MQLRFLVLGIALAGLVIGGLVWLRSWQSTPEPVPPHVTVPDAEPVPVPAPVEPKPQVGVPEQPPEPVLPVLDLSDDFVRASVLERSPGLAAWLDREELVRRFAVVVDNASRGDYPRRQLGYLAPRGTFPIRREGPEGPEGPEGVQRLFMDPKGYARYDRFVELATSVAPAPAAALLIEFFPLLVDALQELGLRGPDARSLLVIGIDQALATPLLEGEVELLQSNVLYEYADPALESLPPLQKQLLRMGPENLDRLQIYLRAMRSELTASP